MTHERETYHRWIDRFAAQLRAGSVVVDVGKSAQYDYRLTFRNFLYRTLDREAKVSPDILLDIESPLPSSQIGSADGVLCCGVTEQCTNPWAVRDGVVQLLKPGGLALWGICCVGFRVYHEDYFRFTPLGVDRFLSGWEILDREFTRRDGAESYAFYMARRPA